MRSKATPGEVNLKTDSARKARIKDYSKQCSGIVKCEYPPFAKPLRCNTFPSRGLPPIAFPHSSTWASTHSDFFLLFWNSLICNFESARRRRAIALQQLGKGSLETIVLCRGSCRHRQPRRSCRGPEPQVLAKLRRWRVFRHFLFCESSGSERSLSCSSGW